jgi:hypothetical protein
MKENIMTVATTYEDRLALIKTVAERRKRMAMVRKQSAKVMTTVKPKKVEIEIPKESNIYAWTDASRYAKEYYGDTLYHTTKFDNDWD